MRIEEGATADCPAIKLANVADIALTGITAVAENVPASLEVAVAALRAWISPRRVT